MNSCARTASGGFSQLGYARRASAVSSGEYVTPRQRGQVKVLVKLEMTVSCVAADEFAKLYGLLQFCISLAMTNVPRRAVATDGKGDALTSRTLQ